HRRAARDRLGATRSAALGAARGIASRNPDRRSPGRPGPVSARQPSRADNLTALKSDRPFKVGVTIHPQQCTIHELRDAWRRADELGVDSIWFWEHFYPLYGDPNGNQLECWSLLAAVATDTTATHVGPVDKWLGAR